MFNVTLQQMIRVIIQKKDPYFLNTNPNNTH